MIYLWLKTLHIVSATVLFGTGLGTAFYQWRAYRDGDPRVVAAVSREVVRADWWFTTPAIVLQPVTGLWMVSLIGYPWSSLWIVLSVALYLLAGACWIPVVALQLRMRNLAEQAARADRPLPEAYRRLFRIWFALGWPAFGALLAVFYLMVFKPS